MVKVTRHLFPREQRGLDVRKSDAVRGRSVGAQGALALWTGIGPPGGTEGPEHGGTRRTEAELVAGDGEVCSGASGNRDGETVHPEG
jgi:hypothetical protein